MNQRHLQKKIVAGIAAVLAVVGIYVVNRHRVVSQGLRITSKDHPLAPDFSLSDLSGQELNLSAYRGKVVLLDFWATWCEPCREEIPHFVELQNKYGDQGLQIIGVSMDDSPEPVRDFYRQFKMNYPVVMGNAKTGELYGGILGLPIAFVVGRDGRIYSRHIGATDISMFDSDIKAQIQPQESSPAKQSASESVDSLRPCWLVARHHFPSQLGCFDTIRYRARQPAAILNRACRLERKTRHSPASSRRRETLGSNWCASG